MADVKRIKVNISKLYLDNENPRHNLISAEPEIISQLIKKESILNLAKHISEEGLSPLDQIGVLSHPKRSGAYVVVEGNRRVCAIKLLLDPDKASNSKQKLLLKQYKEKVNLPSEFEVVLFKNMADADLWKTIRHEGEQNGVGTKKWDAKGKARHNSKTGVNSNPNILAVELLEYATNSGLIDKVDKDKVPLTTLTRYLTNPVVRNALGLSSSKELIVSAPQNEFNSAVSRFLSDAIPNKENSQKVNSRSTKQNRVDYATSLRNDGVAVNTVLAKPVKPAINERKTIVGRNNLTPDARKYIVPNSFRVTLNNVVLKRVFDELRKIDPDFSFASAYLLRAFIEQLAFEFAKKNSINTKLELHVLIGKCADMLSTFGVKDSTLKSLRIMSSDKHSRLSPDSLGAWVHGSEIPTATEIKRRWDTLEKPMLEMINRLV